MLCQQGVCTSDEANFSELSSRTKPAKEELARQGATQGHSVHCRVHVCRQASRAARARSVVVDSAKQLRDDGDAEQIVSVGEKTHPCKKEKRKFSFSMREKKLWNKLVIELFQGINIRCQ